MQKKIISSLVSSFLLATFVSGASAGNNHKEHTHSHDEHHHAEDAAHKLKDGHGHSEEAGHKHEDGHGHSEEAEHKHEDGHGHREEAEHKHEDGHGHSEEAAHKQEDGHDHADATEHKHENNHDHADEAEHKHEDSHDHAAAIEHKHESDQGHNDEHGHEEGVVHLSPKQQAIIDLETISLKPVLLAEVLKVPGEVVTNRYNSSIIAPQADVRVIKRHALLGDHVTAGQPLATLFSDELADRFTNLRNDAKEWNSVRKLGKSLAGKNRYSQAQSKYQQSLTKVSAFGLSLQEIQLQLQQPNKHPLGQFVLKAPHAGVIQQDDFLIGQHIGSNEPLFTLVDESNVWVEAQLPANQPLNIAIGSKIRLKVAGKAYQGTLAQIAHNLNEITRTRMVRISVHNEAHDLHPGQFAQVTMPLESESLQTLLPEAAFTRTPDGDWGVFIKKAAEEFKLQEVEISRNLPRGRVVENLPLGTEVVTSGAFFLASEQAKAGFDIHNH